VKVHGHKHRDAKKLEIKTERVTWNGRVFNVYPDRT
jgi:phage-related protein